MTGRPSELPLASNKKALWLQRALLRPVWTIVVLGVIALTIEVCQQWPEFFFPGHAIGEVVRNLAYALIGAVLFNWILIEIPAQRRRRLAYVRHRLALQFLVQSGPLMLAWYRGAAQLLGATERSLDAWDRSSIEKYVRSIYEKTPTVAQERRQLLGVAISGIQLSLDGLEAAADFFDPDVAVALSIFPAAKGIHQLQPPAAGDPEPWKRDVHIAWELLEGSRRLYDALLSSVPDLELNVEDGNVIFSDKSTWHVSLNELVREA
ncbi:hypothetical protein [Arthrobacter oryzae]|uniref:hypothetical protein n=1 Tax=Arthrobacter oryzae TaxID=409290 RepID=UPI00277D2197|nr:hypothetical protein [Arthrobacter oryzae]MDQ0077912.1 hypothetical protein [Arthrobacter oryzae]